MVPSTISGLEPFARLEFARAALRLELLRDRGKAMTAAVIVLFHLLA